MSICTANSYADFVSDCADVACASWLFMERLITDLSVGAGLNESWHALFSPTFATGDASASVFSCGAADLTPWIVSQAAQREGASLTLEAVQLLPMTPYTVNPVPAASSSSATPRHQWRLITLVALAIASFVAMCADAVLLYLLLPKHRRLQQQAREAAHNEPEHAPA
ncbi:hypothetical protein NESM_000499500 [Novymonas esmeraldas]|uniref:Uncharacterized protein n=1 Tax=Novymonas esmeraldas TaxID=1808958 RepID=A0AAW0ESQ3_9TRYP